MIKNIKLKSGSSIGQPVLEFDLTPITVFVGPNNSGKSKVLMEIENQAKNAVVNPTNLVLDTISYLAMSETDIKDDIKRLSEPFLTENKATGYIYILVN